MTDTKTEAKSVADSMKSRSIFETADAAAEYLTACATRFADFGNYPLAAPGIDSEGNFEGKRISFCVA
jgi:hypothetical protein